jgi:microcystin degradation protein MlrC
VLTLRESWMHKLPQLTGKPVLFPLGDVAALRCGGIDVVVSSVRCQCYCPSIFSELGIEPGCKRLLVVKSAQHFYSTFSPIAAEVIYMAAPGAVPTDPRLNRYRRLDTSNLYPWVAEPTLREP